MKKTENQDKNEAVKEKQKNNSEAQNWLAYFCFG